MAFKYYPALQATDGDQTLPIPMALHNPNAVDITVEFTPEGDGLIYQPFATNADVLDAIIELPTLRAAQSATAYDATTIEGDGSLADITVTTTDVGDDLGAFLSAGLTGVIFAGTGIPLGDGVQTYTPTTDGSGTGFEVTFAVAGTAGAQVVSDLVVVNAGTGYAAGDVLTFTAADSGTFTRTLTSDDISVVFQPSVATVTTVGDNYRAGDIIQITMSEDITVGEVTTTYTYDVQFRVKTSDLVGSKVDYVIGAGTTTPIRASKFKVLGATDRAVTAIG